MRSCNSLIRNELPLFVPALILLAFTSSSLVSAECPVNTVYCNGTECCQGGVVFDVHETSSSPSLRVSYGTSFASCNLVTGSLIAAANVREAEQHESGARAVDVFTMTGLPSATIKVRLSLAMDWVADPSGRMAWADGYARLEANGLSQDVYSVGPGIGPDPVLVFGVLEGQPFSVTYEIIAYGRGYYPTITLWGYLHFDDLPEGAEITSCNGYGSTIVPVEHTTWGGIKALYQ